MAYTVVPADEPVEPTAEELLELPAIDRFEREFSIDGPYSHEASEQVALIFAACVRYFNHATFSPSSTPYASTVGEILIHLHAGLSNLDQLLRQLTPRFAALTQAPGAYVDNIGPAVILEQVESTFRLAVESARNDLARAARELQPAVRAANRVSMG